MKVKENGVNIAFVCLTYNIVSETKDCITSIKKNIDTDSYHIIVVDNNSPNGAGRTLQEIYEGDVNVTVLINDNNEGFARGNNLGIKYAEKFAPKFICCLNNDTLLPKQGFYEKINKEYEKSAAAVIGPKIILKDGSVLRSQRSLRSLQWYRNNLHQLELRIDNHACEVEEQSTKTDGITRIVKGIYQKMPSWVKKLKRKVTLFQRSLGSFKYCIKAKDVVLPGCCLIFTPSFFEKLDGFLSETFMFYEEDILYLDLKENNLMSVYLPGIKIIHMVGVSTAETYTGETEKRLFYLENFRDSLKILIKKMELYEKNIN